MVSQVHEQNPTVEATPIMTITPAAVAKIKELLLARNLENYALRVFVAGGGCSGMQYGMAFEEKHEANDIIIEADGIRLLIDPMSEHYLAGANIDYVDDVFAGGFRIDNPNAVSTCGCGHSFRSEDGEDASGGGCGGGSCGCS
ncbi:MAG: iron-sulfur cluster insertion protein ErpA [Anaerolineae bacterium]|nr:iron-sulfur cluster insertion protein ErpA [Anaerolineae bacterium]